MRAPSDLFDGAGAAPSEPGSLVARKQRENRERSLVGSAAG